MAFLFSLHSMIAAALAGIVFCITLLWVSPLWRRIIFGEYAISENQSQQTKPMGQSNEINSEDFTSETNRTVKPADYIFSELRGAK